VNAQYAPFFSRNSPQNIFFDQDDKAQSSAPAGRSVVRRNQLEMHDLKECKQNPVTNADFSPQLFVHDIAGASCMYGQTYFIKTHTGWVALSSSV